MTKIESLPVLIFCVVQISYMNGRNKGKSICQTLCYGKESWFKRSLVSPLCRYILPQVSENARWEIVQSEQKGFKQKEENSQSAQKYVDMGRSLWYAEYVGVRVGTASVFAVFAAVSRPFVNFTMETF